MVMWILYLGVLSEGGKRWSQGFGPVVKVDQLVSEMIHNDVDKLYYKIGQLMVVAGFFGRCLVASSRDARQKMVCRDHL